MITFKHIFLGVALLLLGQTIWAQTATIYQTGFDRPDPEWSWSEVDDPNMFRRIQNGVMTIEHRGTNIFWTLHKADLPAKHLELETTLTSRQVEASSEGGIGIILAGRDAKFYYFVIYPKEGAYWVGSEQKGSWVTFHGKEGNHISHPAIKGVNQAQKLKVRLEAALVVFLVNDQEVFRCVRRVRYEDFQWLEHAGIVTIGKQRSDIDQFAMHKLTPPPAKSSPAALATAYSTTFDKPDPTWWWSQVDDAGMYRSIKDGQLHIHQKNNSIINWTLHALPVSQGDFEMQTTLTVTQANVQRGAGLLIAGPNALYYYFMIYPNEKGFWVGSEQRGNWKTFHTYSGNSIFPHQAVKGFNAPQELKVRLQGNKVLFVINGEKVFESDTDTHYEALPYLDKVGIVTNGIVQAQVDQIHFLQNQPPIRLAADARQVLKRENLGPQVNSSHSDRFPVISHDGKTLYFIRSESPGNVGLDDIWVSELSTDGRWQEAHNAGFPINNKSHNTVLSVSPDNNVLLLMHRYKADGSHNGAGFSLSHRGESGWGMPKDLPVKNYYNLDGTHEFALSPDRKVLLLAIKRNDTQGLRDLYASFLQPDSTFGEPVRMGDTLNTWREEITPFVAGDGVTLYFASNGHPGYGDCDIFMSKRLDDTWLRWSPPVNLGPYINNASWNTYFTLPVQGNYAMVVSNEEGNDNIYQIELPVSLRPEPVILVKGTVKNARTLQPLPAGVHYQDLQTGQELGIAQTNPADGSYQIMLKAGRKYGFSAQKGGFYPISENIDLSTLKEYQEIKRDLLLSPIEKGEAIRLNNVFFDFSKATLRNESKLELDQLADFLRKNPAIRIELGGHTDHVGTDADNQLLSQNRVQSVQAYLVKQGIAQSRIQVKGYGESKPIASNDTEEGRQQNRRVEFIIL